MKTEEAVIRFRCVLAFTAICASIGNVHAATVVIPATANIFGAGHIAPNNTPSPGGGGGGTAPILVPFAAQAGQTLTLTSVSGSITFNSTIGTQIGPDGTGGNPFTIPAFNGISGITAQGIGYLAGIFVGATEPADPAPSLLNFSSIGTSFASLSPALGQIFFIGDGLTGTGSGSTQHFFVPPAATRLYLGFADAESSNQPTGTYGNNAGSFTATVQIVPEPNTIILLGVSISLALAHCRIRRNR